MLFFFFSSRRRHTRFDCDWSSDVCSSDLAKKAGAWPGWRKRALAEIRLRITKAKEKARGQSRPRWMRPDNDHSPLVEIFLYEGNSEEAWRESQAGGCCDSLWLRLAAVREKEHPEDAAPIY